jgi:hypothetical protein
LTIYEYNPDIIKGMESWLREEVSNSEVFRNDYTTFRRGREVVECSSA